ncbi:hypothetical protein B0H16DRAFT_1902360 [Mycena metata]|uniref:Uncharacterized protein n=1 Tax=Mycena metata TaxID=1033252 RepID=A0AAD7E1D3_9AGAR|nr:hypothetical protein B0H16DRAFT_1902360 [Mycena metata]
MGFPFWEDVDQASQFGYSLAVRRCSGQHLLPSPREAILDFVPRWERHGASAGYEIPHAHQQRRGQGDRECTKGVDLIPHFKELKLQDLTLDGQVEDHDAAAVKKLKIIQAGKGKRTPRHIKGSSKQVMSWIWSAQGSMDSSEEDLHELMRIGWSRALARKTRWCKEVMLLRE